MAYINSGKSAQITTLNTATGLVEVIHYPARGVRGGSPFAAWTAVVLSGRTNSGTRLVAVKSGGTNLFLLAYRTNNTPSLAPAEALRQIGSKAVPYLIAALKRQDSVVSTNYRRFYASLPVRVSELLPFPSLPAAEIRQAAAAALGEQGTAATPAVPALIQARQDPDVTVRLNASRALWKLNQKDRVVNQQLLALLIPSTSHAEAISLVTQLNLRGPKAVEALVRAVEDAHVSIRREAIETLKDMGPDGGTAVATLARSLSDTNKMIRYLALRALEEIGPAAVVALPSIERAQDDPDEMIRFSAALVAARLRGKE
ncbi:MAG: hypothetical protein FJ398_20160 [Verrucomicrobia bacterium]|nr:hypothetical protein [Verrucomicrobiota bacterium]